jgi:tetratricopeptide (TPR) repeat protein
VYSALGSVALNAARWADARNSYGEEQQIRVESGDNYGLAFVYANLGKLALAESGDHQQALRYVEASEALFRQFRDPVNLARALRNKAMILESAGQLVEAATAITEAYGLVPDSSPLKYSHAKEMAWIKRKATPG